MQKTGHPTPSYHLSLTLPLSPEMYFIPVSCFLMFNIFDWLGRSLTAVCLWVSVGQSGGGTGLAAGP